MHHFHPVNWKNACVFQELCHLCFWHFIFWSDSNYKAAVPNYTSKTTSICDCLLLFFTSIFFLDEYNPKIFALLAKPNSHEFLDCIRNYLLHYYIQKHHLSISHVYEAWMLSLRLWTRCSSTQARSVSSSKHSWMKASRGNFLSRSHLPRDFQEASIFCHCAFSGGFQFLPVQLSLDILQLGISWLALQWLFSSLSSSWCKLWLLHRCSFCADALLCRVESSQGHTRIQTSWCLLLPRSFHQSILMHHIHLEATCEDISWSHAAASPCLGRLAH